MVPSLLAATINVHIMIMMMIAGIIPFRLRDITSVKWWAWFIFFWAGAAFFTRCVRLTI